MDVKKILVIDDDREMVAFLKLLLEDNGYTTQTASDGQDGLDKMRAAVPDLVLLDITMPEKSGVRFYREVKGDPALASVPVVMVTGVAIDFKQFIHSRRQVPPPDGYVPKPVDRDKLLEIVAQLLERS